MFECKYDCVVISVECVFEVRAVVWMRVALFADAILLIVVLYDVLFWEEFDCSVSTKLRVLVY